MGELDFDRKALVKAVGGALQEIGQGAAAMRVAAPGGRFHVRWDEGWKCHGPGAVGVLCQFSRSLRAIRPLAGRETLGNIQSRQQAQQYCEWCG